MCKDHSQRYLGINTSLICRIACISDMLDTKQCAELGADDSRMRVHCGFPCALDGMNNLLRSKM